MIRIRVLGRATLAWLMFAIMPATIPLRTTAAQGTSWSPLLFDRIPHDGAFAGDPAASGPAGCGANAALLGGPALHGTAGPGTRVTTTLAGAAALRECTRHRIGLTAFGEMEPAFTPFEVDGYRATVALSFPLRSTQAWVAYRTSVTPVHASWAVEPAEVGAADDSGRSAPIVAAMSRAPLAELTIGAARRLGPISLELSAGAAHGIVRADGYTPGRIVSDSVWTDTLGWVPRSREIDGQRVTGAIGSRWLTGELYASWTHERFAAGASIGSWFGGARMPGVGFGSVELSTRVLPNVWVIGAAGAAPNLARPGGAPASYSSLGLRFAYATRAVVAGSGAGSSAGVFTIAAIDSSTYLFALRAPAARRVELSGEFTRWQAVSLTAAPDGLWVVRLQVAPGAYRANVRIDGGRWQPPPGATPVADDFGGSAGLVVVPPR